MVQILRIGNIGPSGLRVKDNDKTISSVDVSKL